MDNIWILLSPFPSPFSSKFLPKKKFHSFKFPRSIRPSILIVSTREKEHWWGLGEGPIIIQTASLLSQQCLDVYRDGKSPFPHRARVISFFNRLSFLLVSIGIVSYQMAEANISDPFHIEMLCSSALRFFVKSSASRNKFLAVALKSQDVNA